MNSKSPVSLSVHRNTVEARRKRTLAKELRRHAEKMARDHDLRAFAIVGIGADGRAHATWDTGAILPMWAFPATIAYALQRDMEARDVEEDWRPVLPVKGSQ